MSMRDLVQKLSAGIRNGERAALSRGITLVESQRPADREAADLLLSACMDPGHRSTRIAISGPPGAGKSTLIEALGMHVIGKGHRLAVLAIDPSSERTKGSILGDKTRMQELAAQPAAYVRPSPSSGHLGGVARRTREATLLCEAAGYDLIFIETVGVGQSEIAAQQLSDLFLLMLLPGAGDELQGIKRGIVELADMIVVNKADGEREQMAKKTQQEYKRALHLFPPRESEQPTEVLLTSAEQRKGIAELWLQIETYMEAVRENGYFEKRRRDQAVNWLKESFMDQLLNRIRAYPGYDEERERIEQAVLNGRMTPFQGADKLLSWLKW